VEGTAGVKGTWDSIHVFEAVDRSRIAHYKLTSTVILNLGSESGSLGELDLSGNMTRQTEQDLTVENDDSHIPNIGRLVEEMELKMRSLLRKRYLEHKLEDSALMRCRGGLLRKG
jgi:capping protein (actin filament) muscle Z-line, beta